MQTAKPESEAEPAEQSQARIEDCTNSSEIFDASKIKPERQPPPRSQRWNAHRKAEVVDAVRGGIFNLEQLRELYAMSMEEFVAWQRRVDHFGLSGLRVNTLQQDRPVRSRSSNRRSEERQRSDESHRPTNKNK